ncbi:NAD(P)H azoreductase [Cesiribacter andamanensis AMV16]|uniref:NAD(P)H azoreductase n=1 Tax=Cesiribacter andamanensis AMV16 TaxID=1279009 RepID=M7N1T2_9BACT|nr:NAD(P)H azoreductase [Cesiribacter andamanensis AMV16]
MILVVGATGYLGSEICRRLVALQQEVRALVRPTSDPGALARLRSLGVQLQVGDLKNPTSLAQACQDVDTVFSTATTTRSRQQGDSIETADGQGQLNLVHAAKSAGAGRFIYVSYSG